MIYTRGDTGHTIQTVVITVDTGFYQNVFEITFSIRFYVNG